MISIFCSRVPAELPASLYGYYLSLLPKDLQERNLRFKQWKDRLLHLAGKLLLVEALQRFGYNRNALWHIRYNEYGRPYIPGAIDFNTAHSGDYVLCAFGQHVKLGIDIEKISNIDFTDFRSVMTEEQWKKIQSSPDPVQSFFTCWVIKESVIKADSRGLSLPLDTILLKENTAQCDGKTWHLSELEIDNRYCACLATDRICDSISIEYRHLQSEWT